MKDAAPADVLADLPVPADAFVCDLVAGVADHRARIDELIGRFAIDWALERMPAVDRAVLRLAAYELGWEPEVPSAVVISEAVELAKMYSTKDSGRFVNGLLSRIAEELRPATS